MVFWKIQAVVFGHLLSRKGRQLEKVNPKVVKRVVRAQDKKEKPVVRGMTVLSKQKLKCRGVTSFWTLF